MENRSVARGHLSALVTILIWGTTFISTKLLLESFSPVEIMFYRLVLAYVVLLVLSPHIRKPAGLKEELLFVAAGLCGVTLFFLFQNIALSYTLASNVGVLISVSPFFTALLSRLVLKNEDFNANFFIGFIVSMVGVFLIGFNGNYVLKLNPLGDILAVLCALVWAVYSILMKKISALGYSTIQTTRRVFFYGLLLLIPLLPFTGFQAGLARFASLDNIFNMLLLGLGGSALCYVTWNIAVNILGPVKTSVYIYLVPVVTIIVAAIILHEKITGLAVAGVFLILAGLYLSERKVKRKTAAAQAGEP